MASLLQRSPSSISVLSLLATFALFPLSTVAQDGVGDIPGSDSHPAPSVDGDDKKTLSLIVLVALALLGLGAAAYVVRRRRKYAAINLRARRVSDMEAARGQHALTAWRAGGWHNDGGIPLSPRGSAASTAGTARPAGAGRRNNMPNFFRARGNPIVEGLNEDGEAPPPYSPPEPKNGADKETFTAGTSRRNSITTVADAATTTPNSTSPSEPMAPKYEETELARPEPARTRDGGNNQGQR